MEIRTLPTADHEFHLRVEDAVRTVTERTNGQPRPQHMEALLGALVDVLRAEYPAASARQQESLATVDGKTVIYVFRDPPVGRDPVRPMPKLPPLTSSRSR